MSDAPDTWQVYLLRSADGRASYVGIARDPAARLLQHNGARPGGARRTRAGRPWELEAAVSGYPSRGAAERAENAVKRARGLDARRRALATLPSPMRDAPDDEGTVGDLPRC